MSDIKNTNPNVPEAKVVSQKRTRFSLIWLIPLVAAAIGAWIAITTIRNQGPEITVIFKSADGLEAGKTKIKYKDVDAVDSSSTSDLYQLHAYATIHGLRDAALITCPSAPGAATESTMSSALNGCEKRATKNTR